MMKTNFLASGFMLAIIMATTGCSIIQPISSLTEDQKQSQIRNVTRTTIFLAITEIYDESAQQVKEAQELKDQITDNVLPILLNSDVTLDSATEQLLMVKIPAQYRAYVMQAVNVLRLYYTTPQVGEMLTPQKAAYLLALFQGVVEGCELVMETASD